MAVHSLKPATDRCLGGPLPRQLANQTRAHPVPPEFSPQRHAAPRAYAVLAAVSGCCPPVQGRLPTRYSPVRHWALRCFPPEGSAAQAPFDLHVLGTPPAFILSQDQTLMLKSACPKDMSPYPSGIRPFLPWQYVHASLPWFARPRRGMCVSGGGILKIFKDCVILY